MSHFELEFTPHEEKPAFQQEIVYTNPKETPVMVANETTKILDSYFDRRIDPRRDVNFLANQSLSLVYAARKGFLANMQMIRNLGTVDLNHLDALLQMNRAYSEDGPDQEETETFSRMYLAFGIMPDIATDKLLPQGYSRRGILEPPFTLEELYGRIYEVGAFIKGIIGERIKPYTNGVNHPGVTRGYWAFNAMGNMSERNPFVDMSTLNETVESLRQKFQNPEDR